MPITIQEAKSLKNKYDKDKKYIENISTKIERAAKIGLSFIDIDIDDNNNQIVKTVQEHFPGFKVDAIKEHEINDDPFHGKTYKYDFRIWW